MANKIAPFVGVCVLLIKDKRVLLLKRSLSRACGAGNYCLPGGRVDENETIRHAAVREAQEELGVDIAQEDLQFVHVYQGKKPEYEYVFFAFVTNAWKGEPYNKEPHKHDAVNWYALDTLPDSLLLTDVEIIKAYQEKRYYSEQGW